MEKIIIFAVLTVFSMVVSGFYFIYKGTDANKKFARAFMKLNLFVFAPIFVFGLISLVPQMASAATASTGGNGLGFLAAGLSTGLASLGAGVAVSNVGSAAIGAVSEDPNILGKSMIYLGLAEGIAIYGLIISIMILGRL
ncbi:MAG: ATP synthase subunit C [Peptoniphilus sp.]|uniref:ATP synthase subunit C n=1 Tax=Peptoniphilus sp. TaxID=1971214 RepID=UPI0025F943A6|nr:ATP synthase subunit C [Peptoniphilus sp.]MCI5643798.1 ATP synthase subunit C [Peptoniphilus sp.]MDD7353157.1 ATP synthase subunit C [Peptoniphilaceae bacterium]MDY3902897.1 ATP synthase subunit C [Peptoniphilus sp.]